jgi:hypothetical protein
MLGATVPVTVIVIELLVAELVVLQVAILVSSHNITSLFDSEAFEYVDWLLPTALPFSFHWYEGLVPPLVMLAVKVTVPDPEQIELEVDVIFTVGVTVGVTTTLLLLLVAVFALLQVALLVRIHVTTSLLVKLLLLYVELLLPTLLPFSFHWYAGLDPPWLMLAVKVTDVPEHTLVTLGAMLMLGVTVGVTTTLLLLLVAVFALLQVALLVSSHVTTSLLVKLLLLYVELLLPTLLPFNFHWYAGLVPPWLILAVKVTDVPEHTLLALGDMLMLGITVGLMLMFDPLFEPVVLGLLAITRMR